MAYSDEDRRAQQWTVAVWLGVSLLAATTLARAQQGPERPMFRAGTDLVQVDVTVLDKDRRPVRGLTAADFTVKEDGKVRPVVVFTPVELPKPDPAPATPPAAWTRDVPRDLVTNDVAREGRLIVILLDRSIRFDDQQMARRIATRTVDELGPADSAALVFTSQFGNGGKAVDFTNDHAKLRAAIQQPFAVAPMVPGGNSVGLDDPNNLASGDCYCGVCVLDSITRIANALRDVPGRRKTLFFIGTYLRVYEMLVPELRVIGGIGGSGGGGGVGTGLPANSNSFPCAAPLKIARERLETATGAANLTIQTLDPVGIESEGNSPLGGSLTGIGIRQRHLPALAAITKGRTVMNTNAPDDLVPAVLEESGSFYILGFERASAINDGKRHDVEVKVRGKGLIVQARDGYYAPMPDGSAPRTAGASPATTATPGMAAISGVLPETRLTVGASVASFATAKRDEALTTVALAVQQPVGELRAAASQTTRRVDVLVGAFDRRGDAVATATLAVDLTGATAGAGMLRYETVSHLLLKPGHYDLRVSASDTVTHETGSVHTTIDVPDFSKGPVALSEIVFTRPSGETGGVPEHLASQLPVLPSPKREFATTSTVSAFLRVYQPGEDALVPVPMMVRILDTQNRTVFETHDTLTAVRFATNRSADYPFTLPLAPLAPGEYLLTIDGGSEGHAVRRDLRFSVR